jgi:tRNA(fMet)-specific endonuclease VapC
MIAFDTDVLTEILLDNPVFVDRAAAIPQHEQAVPIVVIEEILRGRLNVIRQAEANTARISVARAYDLFEQTIKDFQRLTILSYTPQADALYRDWRQQRIRVSTHDLRIAAICVSHAASLISRNRRDFERVPGLLVEFWE